MARLAGRQLALRWSNCVLSCLACVLAAQAQYRFDSWTMRDGLPQNSVTALVQTRDGYLWFTTIDGLVRFDGLHFKVFERGNTPAINSNRFLSLFEDAEGTLWAGSEYGGLLRYRNSEFVSFTTADGLPANDIEEIRGNAAGELFLRVPGGYGRWQSGQFKAMDDPLRTLQGNSHIVANGFRWRTADEKALREVVTQATEQKARANFSGNAYFDFQVWRGRLLFEDRHGNLWGSTDGRRFFCIKSGRTESEVPQFYSVPIPAGSQWNAQRSHFTCAVEDREGTLWFGTNWGLLCFREGRLTRYSTGDGLADNEITNLLIDREGLIWVATPRGLTRIRKQTVTTLSTPQGLPYPVVNPILQLRNGDILIGTYALTRVDAAGKLTHLKVGGNVQQRGIEALYEDPQGVIWIGSKGEIWRIVNGRAESFSTASFQLTRPETDLTCYAFWQDRALNFWFATNQGLFKLAAGKLTDYTSLTGIPGNDFRVIHEDHNGVLWFGALTGLAKWQDGKFVSYAGQTELAQERIVALHETADGALWIGTYDNGLRRLRDGKLTAYKTEQGLYNNEVFRILTDERENFWISSNKGIYRVSKSDLDEFADGKLTSISSVAYGVADGMRNAECNAGRSPAGYKMRDGKLWFPTQDGVAIVDPAAFTTNMQPPPVVIESVLANHQPLAFKDTLTLQPKQEHLEISYTGLSFSKPELVKFKYKLEGWDNEWIEAGARRTAYYSYLHPGSYRFKVMAANSDGVWSTHAAELSLTMKAAFYRTWWFMGLVIVGLGSLIYAAYAFRIHQLRQVHATREAFSQQLLALQESHARQLIASQEKERQRIATELHDGLGQNLLVIKNRALLGAAAAQGDETQTQFHEINSMIAATLSEVRSISHNLRPPHLERLGLTATLEEMLEQLAISTDLRVEQRIDALDGLFTPDDELHVFRIAQECLNNVIKHARASQVEFHATLMSDEVYLLIRDNGAGCANLLNDPPRGSGWLSIQERVRILRGTVALESETGKGTTVRISIPL